MTVLVCWLNHFLRIIINWHKMLNELSFQMTIQVHMHRDSFFIWLLVVSWIFSQASSWIIAFSDFVCSSRFYFLTWNHMWVFIFYSHDILVMSEHKVFHFIASQSTCSSDHLFQNETLLRVMLQFWIICTTFFKKLW